MRHEETRQKTQKKLQALLILLYGEVESLRARSIGISQDGVASWLMSETAPIIQKAYEQISRDVAESSVDQEKASALAAQLIIPAIVRIVSDDVMSSIQRGRPLKPTTARGQAVTATTRIISISELYALAASDAFTAPSRRSPDGGLATLPPPDGSAGNLIAPPPFVEPITRAIWVIDPASNVCEICEGLDGKSSKHWRHLYPFGPPAHRFCACHLDYED